ncbi:TPA: helix-turn-helix transcriptional regulator [Escherichia coli]|nr:helix-turn-helix transcriptional regulator [Escherichia coli]
MGRPGPQVTALLQVAEKGGIPAAKLASLIGVSRGMMYCYMRGSSAPRPDVLIRIVDITRRIHDAVREGSLPLPERDFDAELHAALNIPSHN